MSDETPAKKELAAIKGTKDILPGEVEVWQTVEAETRRLVELYGYRELRAPVIEPTELFEKGTGETTDIVTKEMYTFTDKGGRSITLRPEYTPSMARAILEHRLDLRPEPMRYYYMGPMFRYDKPQKGRYRQFHQLDIEIFNEKDPAIDAEIIEMADALLRTLGVQGTETLMNSVGCRACRPAYLRDLRVHAEKVRDRLCPDCRRKITTNPLRIFDCKVEGCREQAARFPKITATLCPECREHFEQVCSYLDLYKVAYRIEPNLVRGLDYYTKTTFEIVSVGLGAQNALLGGGRYDDMMKDFGGPDICGIGFAMGLERLISILNVKPEKKKVLYIAYMGDDGKRRGVELARFFRRNGIGCLVEFGNKGFKAQFGRANKLGAAWVLIIGEDEIRKGLYQLKDMAAGTQTGGTAEDLLKIIRKKDGDMS
ncbi:MAG: histidine--tRNA ligase [Candidatus Aminicenantes bacterium]|nr:histidine--tRNA ligase [Candidatus Aminicenantes bacterium]